MRRVRCHRKWVMNRAGTRKSVEVGGSEEKLDYDAIQTRLAVPPPRPSSGAPAGGWGSLRSPRGAPRSSRALRALADRSARRAQRRMNRLDSLKLD
ncbi:hypothetical protein PRIPAC_87970 [Pristionchus pacificus]|uniref:Uncharacterized protein n=1 Tax=Pristionchus pacificus TaxID=54126 RepID=A0A2A6CXR1_PRIPA|nr:hypothetical protein PRIPAC_87970 [Pristionchus pacificus]|eukprot:PDM82813.1 hypothetical protein PRIPAC_37206 [Pristionchus pacificus]